MGKSEGRICNLINIFIAGPCKNFKTKIFQEIGKIAWWIYLLFGLYLINYNPNIFYDRGVIGSFYRAGIGYLICIIPNIIVIVVIGIILKLLIKDKNVEKENYKEIRIGLKRYELLLTIVFVMVSAVVFTIEYTNRKGSVLYNFDHGNIAPSLTFEIIMVISAVLVITPFLYAIELSIWDVFKKEEGI